MLSFRIADEFASNTNNNQYKSYMKKSKISAIAIIAIAATCLAGSAAKADLIGTSVNGSIQFGGNPLNYYDPVNGFVNGPNGVFPGGSLNASGTTVTISGTAVEFGYMDGANTDSADFTGSQLIIKDIVATAAANWTQTFVNPAFSSLSKVSDNFVNGGVTGTLVGDVLTVTWGGTGVAAGELTAVFNVGSSPGVPDGGSTLALLGLAVTGMAGLRRRFGV